MSRPLLFVLETVLVYLDSCSENKGDKAYSAHAGWHEMFERRVPSDNFGRYLFLEHPDEAGMSCGVSMAYSNTKKRR